MDLLFQTIRLRSALIATLAALQFLTITPPVVRRPFTARELGQAVGYFPVAGAVLGVVLAGLNQVLGLVLPPHVTAALILTAWVMLTGALHLDGFLDTCDGLFGGWDPETRLRILRDEQVGAFAVAGGILLLLTKYAAIAAQDHAIPALILAPVLGRWGMSVAIVAYPYIRPAGLGRLMKDHAGRPEIAITTAITLIAALVLAGWRGLPALVAAGLVTLGVARLAQNRLGGLTGDIYGTICEITEVGVLILFVAGG